MSLRLPQTLGSPRIPTGIEVLDAEIASEKASNLGRAGRAVEAALARLSDPDLVIQQGQEVLLAEAADAVWRFFIQREVVGLRDQAAVIRDYKIPRAVIVRLGARPRAKIDGSGPV